MERMPHLRHEVLNLSGPIFCLPFFSVVPASADSLSFSTYKEDPSTKPKTLLVL